MHSLLQLLSANLKHGVPRNNFISPILQIAATLRFDATEHFQITDGDLIGLSQPSVCRILKGYPKQLPVKKTLHYISIGLAGQQVKQEFSTIRGFPGENGYIDRTHIPISSPGGIMQKFSETEKVFSINVRAVCHLNKLITNIVCR